MKKILLNWRLLPLLFAVAVANPSLHAQCDTPTPTDNPCTAPLICGTASLDAFCSRVPIPQVNQTYLVPNGFVGTVESPQWIKVQAKSTRLVLRLTATDCTEGVQAGLFSTSDCNSASAFQLVSNFGGTQGNPVTELRANGLTTNNYYYLLVDGFGGAPCAYTIDVLEGTTIQQQNLTYPAPTTLTGPTTVCANAPNIRYSCPRNRYGSIYNWSISLNGVSSGHISTDSFYVVPAMPASGTAKICVQYESECGTGAQICKTVTVGTNFSGVNPTYSLCPNTPTLTYGSASNNNPANATPTISMDYNGGTPATESINYTWTSVTGCDSVVTINVNRHPAASSTQQFFARPGQPIQVGGSTFSVTAGSGNCTQSGLRSTLSGASQYGCDSVVRFSLHNAEIAWVVNPTNNTISCATPNTTITAAVSGVCNNGNSSIAHNFQYQWSLQGNPALLGTNDNITTSNAGTYQVIVRDSVSAFGKYKIFYDTLTTVIAGSGSVPATPSNVVALATACTGDVVQASVAAVAGAASYAWTLPAGCTPVGSSTNSSITFKMGNSAGNISVVAVNLCGNSASSPSRGISLGTIPAAPNQILGNTAPCTNLNNLPYEVNPVSGASTYTWTVTSGATILSGNGTNSIYIDWGNTVSGTVSVTASNACGTSASTSLNVAVSNFNNLNAGRDTVICGLSHRLTAVSASGTGTWTHFPQSPLDVTYTDVNKPTTDITVSLSDTYNFIWTETNGTCSKKDTIQVIFSPIPSIDLAQLVEQCSPDNSQLVVQFPISGSIAPYKVYLGNTNALAGVVTNDKFVSTAQPPGSYTFLVKDAHNCTTSLTGSKTCNNCLTNAGNMDISTGTGIALESCEKSPITANYLGGPTRFLQADDAFEYVLHTGNPQTGILSRSASPTFSFQAPMVLGTMYFIAAIAGDDSLGHVRLLDPCFNASQSLPIVFNANPTVVWGTGTTTICQNDSVSLVLNLTGKSPFIVVFNDGVQDSTVKNVKNGDFIRVAPNVATTYTLKAVRDANSCVSTANGTVRITVRPRATAGIAAPPLRICGNLDTTITLTTRLAGQQAGGKWIETSTTRSTGSAFVSAAGTFRTRLQLSGTYRFAYVVNGTAPCGNDTAVVVVHILSAPLANAGVDDSITCNRRQVSIGSATNNGSNVVYQWSGPLVGNAGTFSVGQPGTYQLTATDTISHCFSMDTVVVKIDTAAPKVVLLRNLPALTCSMDSVILNGSTSTPIGRIDYLWSSPTTTFSTSPLTIVRDAGIYTLQLTNAYNGCVQSDTITVVNNRIKPIAQILAAPNISCVDTIVTLDARTSANGARYPFTWRVDTSTHSAHFKTGTNSLTPTVDSAGKYWLIVRDVTNACVDSTSITLNRNMNRPVAKASVIDTLNCVNITIPISGRGSTLAVGTTYQWTTTNGNLLSGTTSLTPTVNEPGLYVLRVTTVENGCAATDTVRVFRNNNRPTQMAFRLNAPKCYGECDGSIRILGVTGGIKPYLYSLDGNVFTTSDSLKNLCSKSYRIRVQDGGGCEFDTTVALVQYPQVNVKMGNDTMLRLGDSLLIVVQVGMDANNKVSKILWSNNIDSACSRRAICDSIVVKPIRQTTYQVEVTDARGCKTSARMHVGVDREHPVYFANIFSPNNDSRNDLFVIQAGKGVKKIKTFQIFDRWGNRLFIQNNFFPDDPAHGWDGSFNGRVVNPGVYLYMAEIEYLDGETEIKQGDVTVVR
jgi:gliding motility-associated-like protein